VLGDLTVELTVLYDADCGLCRRARAWLESQSLLVPLVFVARDSVEAWARYPYLDHERTRDEVTVISDSGEVYVAEAAWIACLWATTTYRPLAVWLSANRRRNLARRVVVAVAAHTRAGQVIRQCDYRDACAR
jgi:predicted DCC family thiol-disulfide oxidoreductase YuxK